MDLRQASVTTQLVVVLAVFVIGYIIPFALIQIVFLQVYSPRNMYDLLFLTGRTPALINLTSLLLAIIAAAAAFWYLKPHREPVVKSAPVKLPVKRAKPKKKAKKPTS